jgi:hypothetical protein
VFSEDPRALRPRQRLHHHEHDHGHYHRHSHQAAGQSTENAGKTGKQG